MASLNTYVTSGSCAIRRSERKQLRLVNNAQVSHDSRVCQAPARQQRSSLPVLVAFVLVLITGMISAGLTQMHVASVRASLEGAQMESVRVVSGDTMWSIAERHQVEGVSTSELVQWLREKNGLSTSALMPGQTLMVPICGEG